MGSFVAERKVVMGDAAEDGHVGQRVSALQDMAHRTVRLIAGSFIVALHNSSPNAILAQSKNCHLELILGLNCKT